MPRPATEAEPQARDFVRACRADHAPGQTDGVQPLFLRQLRRGLSRGQVCAPAGRGEIRRCQRLHRRVAARAPFPRRGRIFAQLVAACLLARRGDDEAAAARRQRRAAAAPSRARGGGMVCRGQSLAGPRGYLHRHRLASQRFRLRAGGVRGSARHLRAEPGDHPETLARRDGGDVRAERRQATRAASPVAAPARIADLGDLHPPGIVRRCRAARPQRPRLFDEPDGGRTRREDCRLPRRPPQRGARSRRRPRHDAPFHLSRRKRGEGAGSCARPALRLSALLPRQQPEEDREADRRNGRRSGGPRLPHQPLVRRLLQRQVARRHGRKLRGRGQAPEGNRRGRNRLLRRFRCVRRSR